MSELKYVVEALAVGLREIGCTVVTSTSPDRPHLIVLDKESGFKAFYVQDPWGSETLEEATQKLNLRVSSYRSLVPDEFHGLLKRAVIPKRLIPQVARDTPKKVKSLSGSWLSRFPKNVLETDTFAEIKNFLVPNDFFHPRMYEHQFDKAADSRIEQRFALDADQSRLGMKNIKDLMMVGGPAGSGKTLVLAARAKRLAEDHPEWKIQVLCFNHGLVPYLEYVLGDRANIQVEQFGNFVTRLGHRFSMSPTDDTKSLADYELAKIKGIDFTYDALLIDEVQDFSAGWIRFALDGLFPHRGGALLVGDPNQSIYRNTDLDRAFEGHQVDRVQLSRPYRSTKQILRVVSILNAELEVEGSTLAPNGPLPDVVYANGPEATGRAMVFDIKNLIAEGVSPGNIGVLCLSKYAIAPIRNSIEAAEIPVKAIWKPKIDPLELGSNEIKVITINHSKGIEFDAVLIHGLDELRDPKEPDISADELQTRLLFERVNLVGPTRAKNRLFIYYRKSNRFVNELFKHEEAVRIWKYPDQYPGES